MGGERCPLVEPGCGCGVAEVAVTGRGVCTGGGLGLNDGDWPSVLDSLDAMFVVGLELGAGSLIFRFRLDECSFSTLSMTTFAIRSNSEQTPSMR